MIPRLFLVRRPACTIFELIYYGLNAIGLYDCLK